MYRDFKEKARAIEEMTDRRTRIPKHQDPDALKRFREVPHQLQYRKEKNDK